MPIIKSAKKRARQTEYRTQLNRVTKEKYKRAMRVVKDAMTAGDTAAAMKALPMAYKQIDLAAKKNIFHKSTAARRKSVLARMIASGAKSAPKAAEKAEAKTE